MRQIALPLFSLLLALAPPLHGAPPNILFILTDDQGWPTLGSYGNRLVPTPHLDRLAREGMRFTDAYAMPQCTPTRATLLTGQSTARTGLWHVIPWYGYPWARVQELPFATNLSRDAFTLPKGLKAAGDTTAILGKWHLTANEDGGYNFLRTAAAPHYGFDFSPEPPDPEYPNKGDEGVGWLTEEAIGFIRENRARPWFCYLAHHTLHDKITAPEEIVAKYRALGAPENGLGNAAYLAAIEVLDTGVGKLLAALDELRLAEKTIVVFTADNGGVREMYRPDVMERTADGAPRLLVSHAHFANDPLRAGKGGPYEGGLRVPCLVRWPNVVKPGSVSAAPIQPADWLPTLFEAAGAETPAGYPLDGMSLLPLLRGGTVAERPLFWHLPLYDIRWGLTPCAVVRRSDWKLIEYFGDRFDAQGVYREGRHVELYQLRDDPGESHNVAEREPLLRDALLGELNAWLATMPHGQRPGLNPAHNPARAFNELTLRKELRPTPSVQ